MRIYLSNMLKWDTRSDDMKRKIYHWVDFFEKFHQQNIIMTTESYNYSVPEYRISISVRTPPGLIHQ